ncbi:MAG: hypothetical protein Fur0022_23960 [Anaerolineales bacterium]
MSPSFEYGLFVMSPDLPSPAFSSNLRKLAPWGLLFTILAIFFYFLPPSIDFAGFYRAAHTPLAPYSLPDFAVHNPPWFLLPLFPLTILPETLGRTLNNLLNVLAVVLLVRHLKGNTLAMCAALCSPSLLATNIVSNIEWMPILAALIPGAWGVPWLVIKPQVTSLLIILYWRRAKWKLTYFLPLALFILVSFLIWGLWPLDLRSLPDDFQRWNISLWPWSLPVGLFAFWKAWKSTNPADELRWGLTASILIAPYFAWGSLTASIAAWATKSPRIVATLLIVFWTLLGIGFAIFR